MERIILLLSSANRIFIAGNGGSAALASHFACDLNKNTGKRFRAFCLTDNISMITALANDIGYNFIFSEQIKMFADIGDILILISASGNSENIVEAAKAANDKGMGIISFTGFDGGRLKLMSSHNLHIVSSDYGVIESEHDRLMHDIVRKLQG